MHTNNEGHPLSVKQVTSVSRDGNGKKFANKTWGWWPLRDLFQATVFLWKYVRIKAPHLVIIPKLLFVNFLALLSLLRLFYHHMFCLSTEVLRQCWKQLYHTCRYCVRFLWHSSMVGWLFFKYICTSLQDRLSWLQILPSMLVFCSWSNLPWTVSTVRLAIVIQ